MLDTMKELTAARQVAVDMRDKASDLVEQIDRLLAETPGDLGGMIDSIKERVLTALATKEFTQDYDAQPSTRTPAEAVALAPVRETPDEEAEAGLTCDVCGKTGIKNEAGMLIHMGRNHKKEAEKAKRARVKAAA